MKLIHVLSFLLVALGFVSCEVVYFENPQPIGVKDLKYIPRKFHREVVFDDNKIAINRTEFVYTDSTEITVLALSDSVKLRKSKGNYFLNVQKEDGWWEVIYLGQGINREILILELNPKDMLLVGKDSDMMKFKTTSEDFGKQEFWKGDFSAKQLNAFVFKGAFSDTFDVIPMYSKVTE